VHEKLGHAPPYRCGGQVKKYDQGYKCEKCGKLYSQVIDGYDEVDEGFIHVEGDFFPDYFTWEHAGPLLEKVLKANHHLLWFDDEGFNIFDGVSGGEEFDVFHADLPTAIVVAYLLGGTDEDV
jgi:hypothetical protein